MILVWRRWQPAAMASDSGSDGIRQWHQTLAPGCKRCQNDITQLGVNGIPHVLGLSAHGTKSMFVSTERHYIYVCVRAARSQLAPLCSQFACNMPAYCTTLAQRARKLMQILASRAQHVPNWY